MNENQKQICKKYRELFTTTLGQEVLDDLKTISGLTKTIAIPDTTGHYDLHSIMLNEGGRKLVIKIINNIDNGK